MLTCKQATRLVSEARDRPLTFRERLGLRLHLMACSACTNYNRQLDLIRKACRRLGGR